MAEDFKNIDQIIRQKFDDFSPEPPAHVWEKVRSGIQNEPPAPAPSSGIILPLIVSISILIFLSGLFHHFFTTKTDTEVTANTTKTAGIISTGSTTVTDPSLQQEFYQTPSELPVAAPDVTPKTSETIPVRAPFGETKKTGKKKNTSNPTVNAPATLAQASRTGEWKPGLVQAVKSGELSLSDAARFNLNQRDFRKLSAFTDDYAKKNNTDWSVGVYFNPEVTSSQDQNIENSTSYNFGIQPRLSFNHFFIQSGVNMRFTHDKGNLAVDYNRFLGTYEHVDYMTFDTIDNVVVPTYHTHTQDVFDTVNHYAVTDTKVNYTYLEIPLYFGYRYSFGKFSLFGKAGPAASFLLLRNAPEAEKPEDNARIVDTDYQGPVRYSVNWQLLMGAGFEYQMSKKIGFSLEPTYRLGLKPEYKLSDGVKGTTNSLGVRFGINYNF